MSPRTTREFVDEPTPDNRASWLPPVPPALRSLALVAAVALTGCYRVRIGESSWLRSRPGPAADSAASAAALPGGYALAPIVVPVAPGVRLAGLAATRAGAAATVRYFGGADFWWRSMDRLPYVRSLAPRR